MIYNHVNGRDLMSENILGLPGWWTVGTRHIAVHNEKLKMCLAKIVHFTGRF